MKPRGWIGAICAALSLVVSVAAPASSRPAAREELPAFGKKTVITGSRTAWTDVVLRESIAPVRDLSYEITGAGRVTGVVVVRHGRGLVRNRPTLIAFRAGRCLERGCAGDPQPVVLMLAYNLENHRLPAGRYRIHLIADGAPARVEFTVSSLTGHTALRPSNGARAQLETIQSMVPAGPNAFAGGVETDLRGDGISFVAAWARSENDVAGAVGGCFYREDPPPPPLAFAPGCPQAAGEPVMYGPYVPPAPDGPLYHGIDLRLDRALGAYYVSGSVAEELGAVAFWLAL
ncbi:MAG: hypothetical protein M3279_04595 [Actinomycetota bacterium]|nr:hypothetical protein [Actinomycetota bacterium]